MYFRQNLNARETKPYWEQRRNDEASQPNHTNFQSICQILGLKMTAKEGMKDETHSLEVCPSLLKAQGKGLVITKWQNFSPSVFHMAWKKRLTNRACESHVANHQCWVPPQEHSCLSQGSVWRELAPTQPMKVQSWDTVRILMRSDESPLDMCSAKCRCWEDRVKMERFGEDRTVFAWSDLAAGNAKKVGLGKLHLLCLVLFILCLLQEVEFLCRDNTLTDMLQPPAGRERR